jgi:alpha-L-rhamnosidase
MLKITHMQCESLTNPLGIATMAPRFSWRITTDLPNTMQHKYQIEVTDTTSTLWDSGETDSTQSIHVPYQGKPLSYTTRYTWRVRIYTTNAENNGTWSEWSETAWFETPLEKWQAPFIEADDRPEDSGAKIFRHTLNIAKPLAAARVYATALGVYEIRIGGENISDTCFDPGWTSYGSRLLYQTYDITRLLQSGNNTLTATVGAGWYKGEMGFRDARNMYGSKMAFSAQVNLLYTDGTQETVYTDDTWQFADSPVIYSEIYHGETYDARNETPAQWQNANLHTPVTSTISPFDGVPVRRMETRQATHFFTTPGGDRVLDFGQNLTGRVRFKVTGNPGDTVILRHAEVLDAEGNFYTENLRSAKCTDKYICKSGGTEVYEPFFTFHGFRYVAVDAYPGEINPADFEAIVIYSDMEKTGGFACSEPLINQLQSNITWGLKGNFLDIPTDCPQRDERLGWTGDAQIFIGTAAYLYNVLPFFRKWLRDLALDQSPEGGVPHVVPDILRKDPNFGTWHSACGWADAAVIIPWSLYEAFGDIRILEDQYESMARWVDYVSTLSNNYLWNTGFHFADWVALDAKEGSYIGATPSDLCATAYYAHSTSLLAKTAEALGKTADAHKYRTQHQHIVTAYQNEFFTPTGRLAARTQTAHILSLMFDLTPTNHIPRTIETLVKLIEENGGHLVTGFLGTPYFCFALSQNNRLAEAYKLLQREDYPSWLYQVKAGATTVWEHLDGIKPDGSMWSANMNSFNHYAYGAVGEWLYRVTAGITPQAPGYKKIRIAPQPGGTLTHAHGTLNTPYGTVESRWTLEAGVFTLNVKIPPNTTAEVCLPDGAVYAVGSGEYIYKVSVG